MPQQIVQQPNISLEQGEGNGNNPTGVIAGEGEEPTANGIWASLVE
jgi:hypothetical protein